MDLDSRITMKDGKTYGKKTKLEGRIMKKRSKQHCKTYINTALAVAADLWTSKEPT